MTDWDVFSFVKGERQKLVNYVRSLVRDTADMDAEDVVQDVLLRILERTDMTTPENLAAYLYRSLRNRVIDNMRTRKPTMSLDAEIDNHGARLIDLLQDRTPNALEVLQTREGREELFSGLASLNDMERKVVIAHELEGVPFAEMAEMWNIPRNTLLSHKSRAMRKLKKYFLTL